MRRTKLNKTPPVSITSEDIEKLRILLSLVNEQSQPNLNALSVIVRNISVTNMNIKAFGYDLAERLAAALPVHRDTAPRHVGLNWKASVQADMESDWVAHWCGQIRSPLIYHRKIWEFAYVLQALYENGLLRPGSKGLGFGCGEEPLPSYLASLGLSLTVTDLPAEDAQARGWVDTNQHAANLDKAYRSEFLDRESFDRRVSLREVDMNAIPADLRGYDFCWSVCALEHLGSLSNGLDFIEQSLRTLRPGGLAVHTTEYNIDPSGPTVDNWPTVLFQRKHMEALAERLRAGGHHVAGLDFDMGNGPMDRFIDLPPWGHDMSAPLAELYGNGVHLKVGLDGFACTCFGLVVRKAAWRAEVVRSGEGRDADLHGAEGSSIALTGLCRTKDQGDPTHESARRNFGPGSRSST